MLLKIFRTSLGYALMFIDLISRGKKTARSPESQAKIQAALADLSLYQHQACPFCIKTRRALHKLNANVEIRDIRKNPSYREELEVGGGRVKVPCLRIEKDGNVEWMYESRDIINYLSKKVNVAA